MALLPCDGLQRREREAEPVWAPDRLSICDPCPLWTAGCIAALDASKCWLFLINPSFLLHLQWVSVPCWGLEKASPRKGTMSWALKDKEEMGSGWHGGRVELLVG